MSDLLALSCVMFLVFFHFPIWCPGSGVILDCVFYRLDSSVGRAYAFGAGGRGFESWPHHTKGVKNGTSSSIADASIKGVVLGR